VPIDRAGHGTLIAAGRASEIFDLGDGRVLRRFKAGGSPEREAMVMRHARKHGFPVPEVLEVGDDSLVLEHIAGRTMLEVVFRRPWTLRRNISILAALHERLHRIAAPPSLPAAADGEALLHLDLHPENVILSPSGPVLVDWTNARRGDPALDVAMTWVIAATSGGTVGRVAMRLFLRHFDRAAVLGALPIAAELRISDPNVTDQERDAARRLVSRATAGV
jgi:aminoglycoside phosphotransferase (APT) family kinase protein